MTAPARIRVSTALESFFTNIVEKAEDNNAGQNHGRRTAAGTGTLKIRRASLNNMLEYCHTHGITHVHLLTEDHLKTMIRERVSRVRPNGGNTEPARGTVNNIRDSYRQFVKYCAHHEWIPFQKAGKLTRDVKTLAQQVTPTLIVEEDKWPGLFELAGKRHMVDRVFLELGYTLLIRDSEIARLRWVDFRFETRQVVARRDKGGDTLVMPITDELHETLMEWKTWLEANIGPVQDEWHVVAPRVHNTSFAHRRVHPAWPVNPNKPFGKDHGIRVIKWALKTLGYSKQEMVRQGSHLLRRSGAANLYDAGFDINLIREAMGHKDIMTTLHYIRRGVNTEKVVAMLNRPIKRSKALALPDKAPSLGETHSAQELGDLLSHLTPDELAVLIRRQREKLLGA